MAALRFAQTFVTLREQALKGQAEEDEFSDEAQLYSIAQGFEVLSFKDMGSAYATMNVACINFPQWLPRIKTSDDAERALALLKEHLQIIQQIRNSKREEGSEEYELLRFYRDFLSGHDLRPFWKFTTAYSSYLISQREGEKTPQRWIRQLSIAGLENLLAMNNTDKGEKLTEITNNQGFKRVADAIRQSTVIAQYRRSQLKDRTPELYRKYEVRYGLGQELMREASYRDKFMIALSKFLHEYEAETAREEEKLAIQLGRKLTLEDRRVYGVRPQVDVDSIHAIADLIDRFRSSELIGSMLIAYGYAREPRSGSADTTDTQVATDDEALVAEEVNG